MTDTTFDQDAIANIALLSFPPMIRGAFYDDLEFLKDVALNVISVTTLGVKGNRFSTEALFDAVSELMNESLSDATLKDLEGNEWEISVISDCDAEFISLSQNDTSIHLPLFWEFSKSEEVRVSHFAKESSKYCLNPEIRDLWLSELSQRALSYEESQTLREVLGDTSVAFMETISDEIKKDEPRLDSIIPNSKLYYENLVGSADGFNGLEDFAQQGCRARIHKLVENYGLEGVRESLLLSSHSLLIDEIPLANFCSHEVLKLYDWIIEQGDTLSKVGAFELGLAHLDEIPGIEKPLEQIADRIMQESYSFEALSSLFVLVYGQLARLQFSRECPPYWLRCAAFAHASVIERALPDKSSWDPEFVVWIHATFGQVFVSRVEADMRKEPRWSPQMMSSEQFGAELRGRMLSAFLGKKDQVKSKSLASYFVDNDGNPVGLNLSMTLPGPLEGGVFPGRNVPENLTKEFEELIKKDVLDIKVFVGLINAALLHRVASSHAGLAVAALKKARYQVPDGASEKNIEVLLMGLASLAAVTQSFELASEVRLAARLARRKVTGELSATSEIDVAGFAAASCGDYSSWSNFLAEWLTEVVFEITDTDDAKVVQRRIEAITLVEPDMKLELNKASAALEAFISV